MARRRKKRWIQRALRQHKQGALRRQLGIPVGETIPVSLLHQVEHAPGKLGHRARLALTLRKIRLKRRHHA